jgi:DNA-binding helix-hairpin-helix protein with protein kinase domain
MPRATATRLTDSTGRELSLKERPLAVGGEGAIHEVAGDSSVVAKVYNSPQHHERCEKLKAMAELATPALLKIAAWPTATLHEKPRGPIVGILMPKVVDCKEIHHLYSVAQRKKDFPDADWRFLTHAALNCAIAFDEIHRHGHVIGDVNQKNVMVSNRAIVQFVDCDSFQVRTRAGRVFRCVVGVPEYTPPELQNRSFRDLDRAPEHDRFGLAVLIFHLLMMGRHPFSGISLDHGDVTIEDAIKYGRFAYSRGSQAARMKPPPNTLPISVLDSSVLTLFERAFVPQRSGSAVNRPTASDWKEALSSFLKSLGRCNVDPKHVFPKHAGSCPWCSLLGTSGVFFFLPGAPPQVGKVQFDLLAVLSQLEQIQCPPVEYVRPRPSSPSAIRPAPIPPHIPRPTPRPRLHSKPVAPKGMDTFLDRVAGVGVAAGLALLMIAPPVGMICLGCFGMWLLVLLATRENRKAGQLAAYKAAEQQVKELNDQLELLWEATNPDWAQEYKKRRGRRDSLEAHLARQEASCKGASRELETTFQAIRRGLESNKNAYENLKETYKKDLLDLTKRSAQLQLERHLDGYLIRDAKIKQMTTARILSLSSFGIETALDVDMLKARKVPGIGPVLTQRLNEWRASIAYRFQPQAGVPAAERAAFDSRHLPRLYQLERVLAAGPRQLRDISSRYGARRQDAMAQIQALVDQLARAGEELAIMDKQLA